MNVLHICNWYPNRINISEGIFIKRQIEAVALRGGRHGVVNVVPDSTLKTKYEVVETQRDNIIEVVVYYKKSWLGWKTIWRKHAAYKKGVTAIFDRLKVVDILHAHVAWDAVILISLLADAPKLPKFLSEHSTGFLEDSERKYDNGKVFLMSRMLAGYNGLFPVSEYLRQQMQQQGLQGNYQVIPNVVDTETFFPTTRKKDKYYRFLHVSHGAAHKKVDEILKAFASLQQEHPTVRLTIAGVDDIADYLKMAEDLRIPQDAIDVLGPQAPESIVALMQSHHCFVLASAYETFGVVVAEAFSCGMQVVSVPLPSVKEIFEAAGSGIITDNHEPEALQKGMQIAIEGKQLSSKMTANRIHKLYGKAAVGKRILAQYKEHLGREVFYWGGNM